MSITLRTAAALVWPALLLAQHSPVGYTDTPYLPDGKWRVHDLNRPHPKQITPGATASAAPSDAIVLFDGTSLAKWTGVKSGQPIEPQWKIENGYVECVPATTDLVSKDKFGDFQLHIEWASPAIIEGESQDRGNSGIVIMGRYEVQVLDSFGNTTYADGQAGAMYGQYPPLVNAVRKPGEWQTYDLVFEAPRFADGKLIKPGYLTLFHNGVLVHNHQAWIGGVEHRRVAHYTSHPEEEPLTLQNHGTKVRFRNIWARKLGSYDQP